MFHPRHGHTRKTTAVESVAMTQIYLNDVEPGCTYAAMVGAALCPVRIVSEHPSGGWNAINVRTRRRVRVRSVRKLHCLTAAQAEAVERIEAARRAAGELLPGVPSKPDGIEV